MWRSLAFQYFSFKYPDLRRYLSEGFGIEARHYRAKKWWQPHLKCCKEFQRRALNGYEKKGTLTILGAGRLYDVDIPLVKSKFNEIVLVDIDPSCVPFWKEAFRGHSFKPIICDLTGSYKAWEISLLNYLSNIAASGVDEKALSFLLQGLEPIFPPLPECDVIFSMNILGQLPLSWRDIVHEELSRRISLNTNENGEYNSMLQDALTLTFSKLQEGHILQLESSNASQIILTTDTTFMYYKKDVAKWQCEKALFTQLPLRIEGFSQQSSNGWFWHLAPQGIEFNDYGVIHDISALDLRRE